MEESVGKLQISTFTISELHKSLHLGAETKTLERCEQNRCNLMAWQRKHFDRSKSDHETNAERDKACVDGEATNAEPGKAYEDWKEAAKLLDQVNRGAVSLETFPRIYLLMDSSDCTSAILETLQ